MNLVYHAMKVRRSKVKKIPMGGPYFDGTQAQPLDRIPGGYSSGWDDGTGGGSNAQIVTSASTGGTALRLPNQFHGQLRTFN